MTTTSELSPTQLKEAKTLDDAIRALLNFKESLKDFRLGDVYVLEIHSEFDKNDVSIYKNSMGVPVKYKVVYISEEGVPHLRKLNARGKTIGDIYLPYKAYELATRVGAGPLYSYAYVDPYMKFVPDPDQLDAILLQQEFNPTAAQSEKQKLFSEINKHNKKITIHTGWSSGLPNISNYFKSLKPGDKFWMGFDKVFVFQSLTKTKKEWQITAVDNMQKTHTFNFSYFQNKRLYREAPRSFTKEAAG